MRLRARLTVLLVVFVVVMLIAGTGAFSSITATRAVDVNVAADSAALLQLEPHSDPNGAYAEAPNDQIRINFDNVGADGANPNSTTTLSDVFNVTNQGTQDVRVDFTETGANPTAIDFNTAAGTQLDGGAQGEVIAAGQTIEVAIEIDTTGLSPGTQLIDSITIHAEAV